jgi:hypothetical protein
VALGQLTVTEPPSPPLDPLPPSSVAAPLSSPPPAPLLPPLLELLLELPPPLLELVLLPPPPLLPPLLAPPPSPLPPVNPWLEVDDEQADTEATPMSAASAPWAGTTLRPRKIQ